jgi:two-component system KDP operon response regulator KdpE
LQNGQICVGLGDEGYLVETAITLHEGLRHLFHNPPLLAIIDVSIATPSWDGWEMCRRFREVSEVPIILLTASGKQEHKLKGLSLGADDCLTKPFAMAELIARVRALLRRTGSRGGEQRLIFYIDEDLWVDCHRREVRLRGTPVRLTAREFELLAFLVRHPNQVLSYEQLGQVRELAHEGSRAKVVRHYIWRLRQKLEADPKAPKRILTERGVGYRFVQKNRKLEGAEERATQPWNGGILCTPNPGWNGTSGIS